MTRAQDIERRVEEFARRHALWVPGDRVAVAVSGGSDSLALLLLLHQRAEAWGLRLSVAHFDHRWREGSAHEAEFVAQVAERLKLPFWRGTATNITLANREQMGRRARYEFLRQLAADGRATRVATGHTTDDQAETVLLRLLRGAGPTGLAGILPARALAEFASGAPAPPQLVRPLLSVRREELRAWLRQRGEVWLEDPSNQDLGHRRNWVRHRLLPFLETGGNPALVARLSTLAEVARGEEEFWEAYLAGLGEIWEVIQGGVRAARVQLSAAPLAVRRRLLRDGVRRVQGNLLRVDFAGVETVAAWLAQPPGPLRRLALGETECLLDTRNLVLLGKPRGLGL